MTTWKFLDERQESKKEPQNRLVILGSSSTKILTLSPLSHDRLGYMMRLYPTWDHVTLKSLGGEAGQDRNCSGKQLHTTHHKQ